MAERVEDLNSRIEELLTNSARPAAELEYVLTDGYAHALAMDRSRLALERRMADLAARVDEPGVAQELRGLFPRLRTLDQELRELRGRLEALKRHRGEQFEVRVARGR